MIGTTRRAASSSSTDTSESPTAVDLALGEQVGQEPELRVAVDLGVDPVELEQVERLDAEATQRELALLAQVLGAPAGVPAPRAGPQEARLGRDLDVPVGEEGLSDQLLGDRRAVGVRGVDEVDAELDGAAEHADRARRGPPVVPRSRGR